MVRLRIAVSRLRDLVARLRRVDHLEEGDAVDLHHGVVLGDHLLAWHLDHLLHHVELAPDAVDEGNDQGEAGAKRARIATEALDRVVPALRHDFDAGREHGDEQNEQNEDEDIEAEHGTLLEVSGERVTVSYSTHLPSAADRWVRTLPNLRASAAVRAKSAWRSPMRRHGRRHRR